MIVALLQTELELMMCFTGVTFINYLRDALDWQDYFRAMRN